MLANRLSENPDVNVLLLEAGGKDNHPYIHMPVGFSKMTGGPHTWGFNTVPQKHANGRAIPYAQGKVLGGGSSINAEILRVVIQMIMTGGKTKVPMAGHSKTSRNISCVPKEMLFFLATGMEQMARLVYRTCKTLRK